MYKIERMAGGGSKNRILGQTRYLGRVNSPGLGNHVGLTVYLTVYSQ